MKCKKCGTSLHPEQKLCIECGTQTELWPGGVRVAEKPPVEIPWKKVGIYGGAGLAALIILIVVLSMRVMPPDQVTASFHATDVFALPYVEGASLRHGTFHAALAHGRAIVTTHPPVALDELRDGENVLLVPPGDAHALAQGIRRVMDNPALRERLERGASELAQQFTWDRIAARTADVYKQIVS